MQRKNWHSYIVDFICDLFSHITRSLKFRCKKSQYILFCEIRSLLPYGRQGKCYLVIYGLKWRISKRLGAAGWSRERRARNLRRKDAKREWRRDHEKGRRRKVQWRRNKAEKNWRRERRWKKATEEEKEYTCVKETGCLRERSVGAAVSVLACLDWLLNY